MDQQSIIAYNKRTEPERLVLINIFRNLF